QGQAELRPVELGVAAAVDRVGVRDRLEQEDWPGFGQRPRVFEQERVGDRGDEVVEAVIALEALPLRAVAAPALEPLAEVALPLLAGLAVAGGRRQRVG